MADGRPDTDKQYEALTKDLGAASLPVEDAMLDRVLNRVQAEVDHSPEYQTLVSDYVAAADGRAEKIQYGAVYQNIRESIFGRRGYGRFWLLAAGAAAAAAAVFVVTSQEGENRLAAGTEDASLAPPSIFPVKVVHRSGGVKIGSGALDIEKDRFEAEFSTRTSENGSLSMKLASGERISLSSNAAFSVRNNRVAVQKGAVFFSVPKRTRPFVVNAHRAKVVVHGTSFSVEASETHLQRVSVEEGLVEVIDSAGGTHRLGPGEVYDEGKVQTGTHSFENELKGPHWEDPEQMGTAIITSIPEGVRVWIGTREIGHTPIRIKLAPDRYTVSTKTEEKVSMEKEMVVQAGVVTRLKLDLQPIVPDPEPVVPKIPEEKEQLNYTWKTAKKTMQKRKCQLLREQVAALQAAKPGRNSMARGSSLLAECQLRKGNKERALVLFEEIQRKHAGTSFAVSAAFQVAKLQKSLGQPDKAIASLKHYIARYPSSSLVDDATYLLCETQISTKKFGAAKSCLEGYLRRFAKGSRMPNALMLLATIQQRDKRYGRAAELYLRYIHLGPGRKHNEKAMYRRIVCLQRGRLPGVKSAIRDYLSRYPNTSRAKKLRERSGIKD